MKKILVLICLLFCMIAFIPNCYAINYYDSVIIKTSFSEEINLDEIEKIEIAYADQTNHIKYITLIRENNFESKLENIPVGTIIIEYGIVNNDTIGYYNVSANIYDNYDNTIEIIVNVSLQNNFKNEELVEKIKENFVQPTTITTENKDNISNIKTTEKTTTTTTKNDLEEQEKLRKQEEKKAINRKKNNIIGTILFSLIGTIIFIAMIYAIIKISNANK